MRNTSLLSILLCLSPAAFADDAIPRGAPQQVLDSQTCQDQLLQRVPAKYPAEAMKRHASGYVVSTFDLDGSGHATNIHVVEAVPPKLFDASAVEALGAAPFKSGAVATGCRYVSDFAAVRRR